MRYKKKKIHPPNGLCIGAKVGVHGEGWEEFYITDIIIDNDGDINNVKLNCLWRESLSKIYLLNNKSHAAASVDPECHFQVTIGKCDKCDAEFPENCAYCIEGEKMICVNCAGGNAPATFTIC